MQKQEFKDRLGAIGVNITDLMMEQFDAYYHLLVEWNNFMNLTGITDEAEVYEKHFYDCLLSAEGFKYQGKMADVGSGAGFPGLVLKIAFPELKMTLIEPIGKRCNFLNEVINKLNLKDIEVVNKRSEDYVNEHREEFDIVSARAVSNVNVLSELCVPLLKISGTFVILRGSNGNEEIKDGHKALKLLGADEDRILETGLSDGSKRIIGYYKKKRHTDKKYPRNYGMIKKKPL